MTISHQVIEVTCEHSAHTVMAIKETEQCSDGLVHGDGNEAHGIPLQKQD